VSAFVTELEVADQPFGLDGLDLATVLAEAPTEVMKFFRREMEELYHVYGADACNSPMWTRSFSEPEPWIYFSSSN